MNTDEIETTTEPQANGAMPPAATETETPKEKSSKKKPAKKSKPKAKKAAAKPATAKPKKAKKPAKAKKAAKKAASAKPKATKAQKVPKAKKGKMKLAGGPKHHYPSAESKPSERKAAAERTAKFMKSTAKREEPNADEAKIWKSIKVGSETSTDKMAELFSGNSAKRHSRVRNALRWLRAAKKFKAVGSERGHYKRIA